MKKLYFSLLTLLLFFGTNAQIVNIPNANFKAKLLSASSTNGIASSQTPNVLGSVLSYNSVDTNGDGQIQLSEASNIKYLDIVNANISSLEGIESFTNLELLYCPNNQITSLNVSMLPNLRFIECQQNQLTNLNVTGLTNVTNMLCFNNQLTSLNVSAMVNLKKLYCENNQITGLDLSGLTNLETVTCNNNQIPSLNVSGSTNLKTLNCNVNQISSLNIKNGNSNWVTLSFNFNPNLFYVCADPEDTNLVQTRINSYGYSSTCSVSSYCSFSPGGTNYTIQGINKLDLNIDGCDSSDGIYPNLKFLLTNGTISGTLIANVSGNYSNPVSAGTHSITPQFENPTYFTSSPTSATVTFPVTTSPFVQNFCITPNGVHHDLEVVVIPLVPARPGFDATYKIKYKNKGNQNETATLVFNYSDSVLDYISSTLTPTTASTGSLSWNIGTVTPFQSGEFLVTLNVNSPTETPAVNGGDTLYYTAVINGLNTDETPVDNTATLNQTVVNSFDPNDKKCLEGTTINPSMIGEYVHYQIRFENTGTFPAENIVVKDMIDVTKFDIATLQITDASHSCVTRITNFNQVEFIFEDINLPFDDATNDGYVVFKIKTKSTLVVGNSISNLANIYFDYNFPIVTNTATSTFQVLGSNEFDSNNALTLYPIPVKDNLNFSFKNNEITSSISIYNLLGQLIQTVTNPSNSIDVSNLQSGSYLIKVTTDKGISSGKFVKE